MDNQKYLLEVELVDCHTKIVREIVVPADMELDCLHGVIQCAMGWSNSHLHEFKTAFGEFGPVDPDYDDENLEDEHLKRLSEVVSSQKPRMEYIYDFGDNWHHVVTVKSFDYKEPLKSIPRCLTAIGACPPEDVGSSDGYRRFCEALNDRKHPEHKEMFDLVYKFCGYPRSRKWPDGVSLKTINQRLNNFEWRPDDTDDFSDDDWVGSGDLPRPDFFFKKIHSLLNQDDVQKRLAGVPPDKLQDELQKIVQAEVDHYNDTP